jgi:(p)ppGpp synthase/HD superfamily hydrolase
MLTQQELISMVIQFAVNAHMGQKRKYSDQPYVAHPIRVMNNCLNYTSETPVLLAAVLHDVLEDTAVTADQLLAFLQSILDADIADKTLNIVVDLTDIYTKKN